jgi:uncharacterized protein (TIGR00255 family)
MSIASMTGFARASGEAGKINWGWELKSVNGRGLELRMRLPNGFEAMEVEIRRRLNAAFARGSFNVSLQVRHIAGAGSVTINEAALASFLDLAERYRDHAYLRPPSLSGLLSLPGVVETFDPISDEETRAEVETAMLDSFDAAVADLRAMRLGEGAALRAVLSQLLQRIAELVAAARAADSTQPETLRQRFTDRVQEFLQDLPALAPERVAQEVAMIAAKADVREELDRLEGHVAAARDLLVAKEPIGRKLDFLAQEFNREANTLCSKSADMTLTQLGLELKNVIGQWREQVQNVE